MKVLIDGDVLRYRVGFACEYEAYWYSNMDHTIRGKKAWKEYREEHPEDFARDVFCKNIVEPVENCLHSCKLQLHHIKSRSKATSCQVYLTGKGNFREEVATIKPYKGNRPDRKPVHYAALTEYMINQWNAIIVDGMEADDALAIRQTEANDQGELTCIASIDKDLLQVPGYHYDFYHDVRSRITEEDGLRRLYTQIIAGDSTDNIGGIPGIGVKGADKLLRGFDGEDDYFHIALDAYRSAYDKNRSAFGGLGALDALIENARLVYLLRKDDDLWEPPTQEEEECDVDEYLM